MPSGSRQSDLRPDVEPSPENADDSLLVASWPFQIVGASSGYDPTIATRVPAESGVAEFPQPKKPETAAESGPRLWLRCDSGAPGSANGHNLAIAFAQPSR